MKLVTKVTSMILAVLMLTTNIFAAEEGQKLTKGINSYSYATVADLQKVTSGTRLYGYEEKIIEMERTYQVNAFFILAVANVETGMGCAGVGRSRNNCFGMKGGSGFQSFENTGQSVEAFCKLIANKYFANGRYTAYQIGQWYCDTYWATKVTDEIDNLYYKMSK